MLCYELESVFVIIILFFITILIIMPVEQIVSAWSLQFAHPEHIPESPDQGPITLENAGDRLFLRCERQVSLPPLFCVLHLLLFLFHTGVFPLLFLWCLPSLSCHSVHAVDFQILALFA